MLVTYVEEHLQICWKPVEKLSGRFKIIILYAMNLFTINYDDVVHVGLQPFQLIELKWPSILILKALDL